jgi:hypothetical protein
VRGAAGRIWNGWMWADGRRYRARPRHQARAQDGQVAVSLSPICATSRPSYPPLGRQGSAGRFHLSHSLFLSLAPLIETSNKQRAREKHKDVYSVAWCRVKRRRVSAECRRACAPCKCLCTRCYRSEARVEARVSSFERGHFVLSAA